MSQAVLPHHTEAFMGGAEREGRGGLRVGLSKEIMQAHGERQLPQRVDDRAGTFIRWCFLYRSTSPIDSVDTMEIFDDIK